jgi:hypothetical protein
MRGLSNYTALAETNPTRAQTHFHTILSPVVESFETGFDLAYWNVELSD